MKKIPTKNYIMLVILFVVTIFLTLFIFEIYKGKNKKVSNLYNYLNKITINEIDSFIVENPEAFIYISDKYNISYKKIEKALSKKINSLNLHDDAIYIDVSEIKKEEQTQLLNKYSEYKKCGNNPLLLIIQDKNIVQSICINETVKIDDINFEVFK